MLLTEACILGAMLYEAESMVRESGFPLMVKEEVQMEAVAQGELKPPGGETWE